MRLLFFLGVSGNTCTGPSKQRAICPPFAGIALEA
jgi:hypothetical protein